MTADVRMITVTDEAACRQPGVDPEFFFTDCNTPQQIKRATSICNGADGKPACPFLEPCLAYALAVNVQGVWGGTTVTQRRDIRRARGINAKPAYFSAGRNNAWVARQMHSRGVPVRDIADRLGISDQAVRQILARAS